MFGGGNGGGSGDGGDGGGVGDGIEVQMFPVSTTAASLVPSLENVMLTHNFVLPTDVSSIRCLKSRWWS